MELADLKQCINGEWYETERIIISGRDVMELFHEQCGAASLQPLYVSALDFYLYGRYTSPLYEENKATDYLDKEVIINVVKEMIPVFSNQVPFNYGKNQDDVEPSDYGVFVLSYDINATVLLTYFKESVLS